MAFQNRNHPTHQPTSFSSSSCGTCEETSQSRGIRDSGISTNQALIRGDVEGIKLDEIAQLTGDADEQEPGNDPAGGKGLAGALIGLFHPDDLEMTEQNAIMLTTSAEDGAFSFRQVPFGHWVIKEVAAPEAYTLSPELHHVYIGTDGQVISIRIANTKIRGNVQLVKTDAADPRTKLPGAVFELYEDTNGDGVFDDGDTLLGVLDEPDAGIHEWRGLLYSGYFILEKTSPAGFLRDENVYYFEIRTDGETVIIENGEKGNGFTNVADGGTVRIIKDSSDWRRYGFSFLVEGDGYKETFTTGPEGLIVAGLKPGKYTISEVKDEASAGYILPAPATVEIKQGETVYVQFYNKMADTPTPETPKPTTPATPITPSTPVTTKTVPQTGDNYAVYAWVAVLGIALMAGVLALLFYKK